tara:strand:+ start:1307 stop:2275 length:969 start_codon:yes stop_codon:yes gene_type:complete
MIISLKKKNSIIVGGSGQLGFCLTNELIKKKYHVIITTRNINKSKKKINIKNKNIKLIKLDVLKIKQIEKIIDKYKPKHIFYFAGQSSPNLSFKKPKQTYLSNFIGCSNFLKVLKSKKNSCKFLNASSSEIFAKSVKKISINSKKKPISPYGKAKLLSFNLTKEFRKSFSLKTYNAVLFNTESFLREKNFLIPKICLSAINAYKFKKKTKFGNLNIVREWNWCEEQVKYILKFIEKKPQDFLLSNQRTYSAYQMLAFAFEYFNLDYKRYILQDKKYFRPDDFKKKRSNSQSYFKKNNISYKYKIYGRKMINKIIKYYLNEFK